MKEKETKFVAVFTISCICLFLYYFNYTDISNEEYIPTCLGNLDLLNILIVFIFIILGLITGLFKFITQTVTMSGVTEIRYTILKFILMAVLLMTFHIYSLKFINYIYCY